MLLGVILCLPLSFAAIVHRPDTQIDDSVLVGSLEDGAVRHGRQFGVARTTTTSYTTTTITKTVASFCACNSFSCVVTGAKRRRRDITLVDKRNRRDIDDMEYMEDEVQEAIVKSADAQGIDLSDFDRAYILPSPSHTQTSLLDETVEEPLELSVEAESSPKRARNYGSFITIKATLSSTITTTSTSTIGTVGLTLKPPSGDTQTGCPMGSIQSYISICPNKCT